MQDVISQAFPECFRSFGIVSTTEVSYDVPQFEKFPLCCTINIRYYNEMFSVILLLLHVLVMVNALYTTRLVFFSFC